MSIWYFVSNRKHIQFKIQHHTSNLVFSSPPFGLESHSSHSSEVLGKNESQFTPKPSQQTYPMEKCWLEDYTPWKFNIAPENIPSQKESNLKTIIFQGLC